MSQSRRQEIAPQAKNDPPPPAPTAPAGRRLALFRFAAAVVLPVTLLVLVELGLRIVGYGDPTGFTLEDEINGQQVRVDNRRFSWQFFPRRIARPSDPLVIPRAKPPDTYRIFVLGASAAKGDPDAAFSFGRILEFMLKDKYPGVHFEVHNTAITAINSHVVLEIARDCARWDSDLFIVYLGNNEVVGPFGAGTVFSPMLSNLAMIRASTRVGQMKMGQLLKHLMRLAGREESGPKTWQGMAMFLEHQVRRGDVGMETVYSHFRRNLQDICRIAGEAGAQTIVSNVGVNLKDCAPLASQHRPNLTAGETATWEAHYQAAVRDETAEKWPEAIEGYLKAGQIDDEYADLHYRLGRAYWSTGDFEKAREGFSAALEYDTLRFRADPEINRIIREVAVAEGAANGVHFVDAVKALAAGSSHNTPGRELFFEHVHLNFAGNYIVARSVFEKAAELFPPWVKEHEDTGRDLLTEADCMDRLVYTKYDRSYSENDMLRRIEQPPFTNRLDNQEQQQHIQNNLKLLGRYDEPEEREQAIRRYEQAIREDPSDWRFHYNFARLLDVYDEQERRAAELKTLLDSVPHYPLAWMQRGDAVSELGDYGKAITFYERALELQPENTLAHADIGIAYDRLGNTAAARKHFDFAVEDNPEDLLLLIRLAQHKASLKKHQEAIGYFQRALALDPRAGEVLYGMGFSQFQLGRFKEAEQLYRRALEFIPDKAGTYSSLGNVLVAMGKGDEAIENFSKALRLSPENTLIRANLANALMEMSRFREAAEQLNLVLEKDPGYPGLDGALGLALAQDGDYRRAITFLSRAIQKDPDNSSLYLNLGNTLLGLGEMAKAVEQYEKVLQRDPANLRAHNNLAYCYLEHEDWKNAIAHFQQYLQINPGDQRVRDQLAAALRQAGKE